MKRETSAIAFKEIKESGLLSARRFQVYQALYYLGPSTQNEVVLAIANGSRKASSLTPRFAELLELGVIEEIGKTTCTVTGKLCIRWQVTENLPTKIQKRPKLSCSHCKGTGIEPSTQDSTAPLRENRERHEDLSYS